MAYPVVSTSSSGGDGANTMTHPITLPASIAAGDLLIIVVSMDGNTSLTWPIAGATYTALSGPTNSGGGVTVEIRYRIADGSEGSSFDIITAASERCSFACYRITGWHGTTPPEAGTPATGSSVNPDPPSVTASWGSAENLFIAAEGWGSSVESITAYPANYTGNQITDSAASANQAGLAVATRDLTNSTDDPGAATISNTDVWVAMTVVVRPGVTGSLSVNNNESVSVTESVAADVSDPQVSASDAIGVAENKELLITSFVDVNDAINVGENSELLITSFVEVIDAIGVAESTAAEVSGPQVNASDTIGVAESVSLAVVDPGTTNVSVTDAISVAENVAVEVSAPQVGVNDAIGVAENNDLLVTSFVTVSEAITLTDTPSLAVSAPQVNVSDGINVAESVSLDGLLPPPPAASGDGTIYFGQQAYQPDKEKEKRRRKLQREDEELLLLL